MKKYVQVINSFILALLFTAAGIFQPAANAAETTTLYGRDGDVDALLADSSALTGALPPTGGVMPVSTMQAPPAAQAVAGELPAVGNWQPPKDEKSMKDQRAEIFDFKGKVRVQKKGTDYWTPVYKKMRLEEGDKILTSKDSTVSARYDDYYLDMIHIEENTFAVIESIEPTQIHLEKGTIFHYLDARMKSRNYRVSTSSSTLGIRGTHAVSAFDPLTNTSLTATVPVKDNHASTVEVFCNASGGGKAALKEGQQIQVAQGEGCDNVVNINPDLIATSESNFEGMAATDPDFYALRDQGVLPPTGGAPDLGAGDSGDGFNNLDPLLDSGLGFEDPIVGGDDQPQDEGTPSGGEGPGGGGGPGEGGGFGGGGGDV